MATTHTRTHTGGGLCSLRTAPSYSAAETSPRSYQLSRLPHTGSGHINPAATSSSVSGIEYSPAPPHSSDHSRDVLYTSHVMQTWCVTLDSSTTHNLERSHSYTASPTPASVPRGDDTRPRSLSSPIANSFNFNFTLPRWPLLRSSASQRPPVMRPGHDAHHTPLLGLIAGR